MLLPRRVVLASMLPMNLFNRMPLHHLPPWLPANERSLLARAMREGVPLAELQRTNFARIREAIGDAQIVLIGEATHGTEEFYRIRADLTKCLLEQDGFDACLCESDFPETFQVNRFVGGTHAIRKLTSQTMVHSSPPATAEEAMAGFRERFPRWMWFNDAMRDFVLWLRHFNASRRKRFPVQLLGLDIYSLHRSMDEVVNYLMDAGEESLCRQVIRRYSTLNKFPEPSDYGKAAVPAQADNVAKVLTDLYKHENQLQQMPGNGQEFYNAIENAHVVAAAEAYFRQMYTGDVWNLRDSAFLNTITSVITYLRQQKTAKGISNEPVRVVVWAHNSHIGDASATGVRARGQHNLGQLCRQVFGKDKAFIVGFSTFGGTVRAAKYWGGDDSVVALKPAMEGSHEYLLHLLAQNLRWNAFGYILRSNSHSAEIDTAARELFQTERVERFVGVSYKPDTEIQSHYSTCCLSNQFDYIIHVDQTSALRVEQIAATQWDESRGERKRMDLLKQHGHDYKVLLNKTVQEAN